MKKPVAVKGDIIQIRDWMGEVLTVKVNDIGESPQFGDYIDGYQVDVELSRSRKRPVCWRHVALPVDHIIHPATLTRIGRGKWEIEFPDGSVERAKSNKAAKDRIKELGFTLMEELL